MVIMLAVVAGCVVWYKTATTPFDETAEPLFTKENYPRVDASLAIHPLVDAIAANFLCVDESELDYEYTTSRSSDVYHNLIDGKVDVIFAAEISPEDEAYAAQQGVELKIIPATASAFVFIVNSENPVDGLTFEQIQDIYTGKITNWSQVGGVDADIIPYQRPTGSDGVKQYTCSAKRSKSVFNMLTNSLLSDMSLCHSRI